MVSGFLFLWHIIVISMEEKESSASGVAVKVDEAPESFRIASSTENPTQVGGGPTMAAEATAAPPVSVAVVPATGMKKKRGRPRKYVPDGTVATALSPMPISSSIPLTGEFSAWKRGRGRPIESIKKPHKSEYESPGKLIGSCSCYLNFFFLDFVILNFLPQLALFLLLHLRSQSVGMVTWWLALDREEE